MTFDISKIDHNCKKYFTTHNFDFNSPIEQKIGDDTYKDYKCITCGIFLVETLRLNYEFSNTVGICYGNRNYDNKTCSEIVMESVLK